MTVRCVVPGSPMDAPRHGKYAVIRYGDEWRLMYGTSVIGQFRDPDAAAMVADKLCRAVAGVGFEVELTTHTWAGELRTERLPAHGRAAAGAA